MTPHVGVIGGGWAGCAAALTLAEAGVRVTLHEAGRTLGGRARAIEIEGHTLDNGQHILLGAYEQTLALIDRASPDGAASGLWHLPLALEQPPDFRLACPRLPAPLHLLAGLLGATGLAWREKLAAVRWATSLLHRTAAPGASTVSDLTRSQPERLNRLLWHPLCISALNTPPERACARVFRDVLRGAFGSRARHSDLVLPRRDLSALFPTPAAARLAALGGEVRTGSRIQALELGDHRVTLRLRERTESFSHAIVAVAPQHVAALVGPLPKFDAIARMIASYTFVPIATGYVQYDPTFALARPMFALAAGPAQFVFDRGQSHGQPGLLAFVASAAAKLAPDWLDAAEAQLQAASQPGRARWRRRIVEKQATYACVPGMPRPEVRTPHPRLFLAGDYTAGPYPATLESATRSGVQSAAALLEQL